MNTKEEVKKIIEKEVLSFWDFKTLLEYISDSIKDNKIEEGVGMQLLCSSVGTELKSYIDMITDNTVSVSKNLIKFQENIIKEFDEAYKIYESKWNEFYKRKTELDKKMGNIEFPKINLPYNWKEYIELSEKLAGMSDKQRDAITVFFKSLL